jgi:ABC-2 type transport system ATP-binding protein
VSAAITVREVSKSYGDVAAVDGVSFDVARNSRLLPRIGVQLQSSSFFERLTARESLP